MIEFKCKMCGGTLNIVEGETIAECESCGAKQTISNLSDLDDVAAKQIDENKKENFSGSSQEEPFDMFSKEPPIKEMVAFNAKEIVPFLKRAFLFLEDGNFERADEYAEKVLDINPECSEAYVVKLLIDLELCREEQLTNSMVNIADNANFKKALRFANEAIRNKLLFYQKANERYIIETTEEQRKEEIYQIAIERVKNSPSDNAYKQSIFELESIIDYKDAREQVERIRGMLDEWYCKEAERVEKERIKQERKKLKRKKRRKIIVFILIAIIIALSIFIPIYNADLQARHGLRLREEDGYYVVTGVVKIGESVVVPSEYKGKPVKEIGYGAFEDCEKLKSITIPDTITSIGRLAFRYCENLTSITIPDSVTSIGDSAFLGCDALTSVTLPDSITTIEVGVFHGCISLVSIVIPDSVTSIDSSAFGFCYSLKSITIPDSVTFMGDSVFESCYSLTSMVIPDSVTGSIGWRAFNGCKNLKNVVIGDGVKIIEDAAFYDCDNLVSIVIGDSVTAIGLNAFGGQYGSLKLKKVYYKGSSADWSKISIYNYNMRLTAATRYYYSETQPVTTGNYWHYVNEAPTIW